MAKKRILVTGGTGFIGKNIITDLVKKDRAEKIWLTTRVKKETEIEPFFLKLSGGKVKIVEADLSTVDLSNKVTGRVDLVYHSAGLLGKSGLKDKDYFKSNSIATGKIIDFCQVKKAFLIHLSSAGVTGPLKSEAQIGSEKDPLRPSNIYERTKAEAEKMVLKAVDGQRIKGVVIRPEFVYGSHDKHVLGLYQAIKRGVFFIPGNGNNQLHPTFIDDLISALNLMVKNRDLVNGQVFIIAGPKPLSVKKITREIAQAIGVVQPQTLPYILSFCIASLCDLAEKITKTRLPFSRRALKFFNQRRAFSWGKANRILKYSPKVSYRKGINLTIDWCRQEGLL